MLLPPPISPLFPYTTLFRSRGHRVLPQPVHHVLELPADDRTGRLLRRPRRGRPVAAAQGQGYRLHLVLPTVPGRAADALPRLELRLGLHRDGDRTSVG